MKVPLNWLKEFVEIDCSPTELAEWLTMAGLEVEEITRPFSYLEKVQVVRITAIKPHPNADRLKICQVSDGNKAYEIVCGAPNVQEGILVPLALPGCSLPSGLIVKEAKIRGIKSAGMLCSQKELGLGEDHSGIWLLPSDFQVGTKLIHALYLNDTVLGISITPNRGDCLSMIGVAREVAAITKKKIRLPQFEITEIGTPVFDSIQVTIKHPEHCFRYIARFIRDVEIKPSPLWMQARLLLAGIRPINNIVDITNYVMLEYGQPLHAFDAQKIAQRQIIVRLAHPGEKLVTLDQKEQELKETDLVICDANGPVALAGVMGGLNSEIGPETKEVVLESAYFHPITIRRTAKRLGINTESSYRFEREVDPEATYTAAQRACYFMQKMAQGKVAPGIIDVYPSPKGLPIIYVRIPRIKQILGIEIPKKEIIDILERLQIKVKASGDKIEVIPPSFRHDLVREVDIIEEIARLYGYERIPSDMPVVQLHPLFISPYMKWRDKIKHILSGLGWHEIISYAFIDLKSFDRLLLPPQHPLRKVTKLINPISVDRTVMRSTLIPGLLEAANYNQRQRIYHFRLFELGKVFIQDSPESLPIEKYKLAGVMSGYHFDPSWHFRPEPADFYDLKGTVENLLDTLGIEAHFESARDICYLNPNNAAYVLKGERKLGYLGEVNTQVKQHWELKRLKEVFVFELDLETLWAVTKKEKKVTSLPKFPSSERDVSLVVPKSLSAQPIEEFVLSSKTSYIENIELIDVYEGPPLPKGKRNLTYRLTYRAPERTLTDSEVDKLHKEIVSKILNHFKIEVRQ